MQTTYSIKQININNSILYRAIVFQNNKQIDIIDSVNLKQLHKVISVYYPNSIIVNH